MRISSRRNENIHVGDICMSKEVYHSQDLVYSVHVIQKVGLLRGLSGGNSRGDLCLHEDEDEDKQCW